MLDPIFVRLFYEVLIPSFVISILWGIIYFFLLRADSKRKENTPPKVLDDIDLFRMVCKSEKMWGLYLNFVVGDEYKTEEVIKAVPFIKNDLYSTDNYTEIKEDFLGFLSNGVCYILFATEEKCEQYYHQVVGDDGPTETNPYNGPCRVYALTCKPDGNLKNENT